MNCFHASDIFLLFHSKEWKNNIAQKVACGHNCRNHKNQTFVARLFPLHISFRKCCVAARMFTFWSLWAYFKRYILLTCYAKMVIVSFGWIWRCFVPRIDILLALADTNMKWQLRMIHFYFLTPKKEKNIAQEVACGHNRQNHKKRCLWHDFSLYTYPFGSVACCMFTFWSLWAYFDIVYLLRKDGASELWVDLKMFCSQNGHHPRFNRYLRQACFFTIFR